MALLEQMADPVWQDLALCKVEGKQYQGLWFPESRSDPMIPYALKICAHCPVRPDCYIAGIEGKERGIWGGVTEWDRPIQTALFNLVGGSFPSGVSPYQATSTTARAPHSLDGEKGFVLFSTSYVSLTSPNLADASIETFNLFGVLAEVLWNL